jgi:hypothetical protein
MDDIANDLNNPESWKFRGEVYKLASSSFSEKIVYFLIINCIAMMRETTIGSNIPIEVLAEIITIILNMDSCTQTEKDAIDRIMADAIEGGKKMEPPTK